MIWVDYVFIGIVLISVLVGVFRGLVREALSLAVWVLAFVLSLRFAPLVSAQLESSIHTQTLRTAASYAVVFIAVLIAGALFTWLVAKLVHGAGLGGVDRMLGAGFGLIRGALICVALVLLASESAARQEAWWKQSFLVPKIEPLAADLRSLIPEHWLAFLQPRDPESPSPKLRSEP